MSESSIQIKFRITYPTILFVVVLLHAFLMWSKGLTTFTLATFLPPEAPTVLNVRRVKTPRVEHPFIKPTDSVITPGLPQKALSQKVKPSQMTLKDLAITRHPEIVKMQRPGTRPEPLPKNPRAMNRIGLKSKEIKESRAYPSGGLSISDLSQGAQKVSDAVVSIEVPDGIEPDQLNEYELKFYGFQKRTAINYINSIIKNVGKFQRRHPHYQLPNGAHITMTARLTYDPEGNVKQIKMIRWTHIDEIQNLFEDIVKNIDQLHNPPKTLWEKDNEFSMFYTLEIVNG